MAAILDFQKAMSWLFEELESLNSKHKLITITGTFFGMMGAILDFVKGFIFSIWRARADIQNLSWFPQTYY